MITDEQIAAAKALGVEHANNAASWTFDGNSDRDERARVLAMLRDGDPQAWDYLPREPNLSGEFAEGLTPAKLYEEIGAEPDTDSLIDALCAAYEDGVSETFGLACESELIKFCE